MKKTVIIPICMWLIFPFLATAQENQQNQSESTIYCAEFDITIAEFESVDPSIIRVCCGGPFTEGELPCRIVSKAQYESFSGQSEVDFNSIHDGFFLTDIIETKKHKLSKVKEIEVIDSSVTQLGNKVKIGIKKGNYTINNEGYIFLELEFFK